MAKKTTKSAEEIAAEASKAEMDVKRAEITAYYKDSVKHLKIQLEYETILKDIEVARAERVQSQMFIANAMAKNDEAKSQELKPGIGNPQRVNQAGSDWDANSNQAPPVPPAEPKRALKRVDS